jgi:hypothetical protein
MLRKLPPLVVVRGMCTQLSIEHVVIDVGYHALSVVFSIMLFLDPCQNNSKTMFRFYVVGI